MSDKDEIIDGWIATAAAGDFTDPIINISTRMAFWLGIDHLTEKPSIVGSQGYVDISIAKLIAWRDSAPDDR